MVGELERYATFIWQEIKRDLIYRIQTNDNRVARKLKKRKKAKLVLWGLNAPIWVFQIKYSSPRRAIIGLGNITGEDVEKTAYTGIFVSYTLPYMDTQNVGEVNETK